MKLYRAQKWLASLRIQPSAKNVSQSSNSTQKEECRLVITAYLTDSVDSKQEKEDGSDSPRKWQKN